MGERSGAPSGFSPPSSRVVLRDGIGECGAEYAQSGRGRWPQWLRHHVSWRGYHPGWAYPDRRELRFLLRRNIFCYRRRVTCPQLQSAQPIPDNHSRREMQRRPNPVADRSSLGQLHPSLRRQRVIAARAKSLPPPISIPSDESSLRKSCPTSRRQAPSFSNLSRLGAILAKTH
jgi:hypothetical protein